MRRKGLRIALAAGVLACLAAIVWSQALTRRTRHAAFVVRFSPRGDRVVALSGDSTSKDGWLQIWETATGRLLQTVATAPGDLPLSLAFAPDGLTLAVGGWDGRVDLRDAVDGRLRRSFEGHTLPVRGLAFLPDGRRLAAGASDGRILVWDVASGEVVRQFERGTRLPVNQMAVSGDGRYLAVAGGLGAGAVGLWDLETGRERSLATLAGAWLPIAFLPGRGVLAAGIPGPSLTSVPTASLIEIEDDRQIASIPIGLARCLAFSPDGRLLASGGDEEVVTVRDRDTGRIVATHDGHRHADSELARNVQHLFGAIGLVEPPRWNTVWSLDFSPDGKWLASCGEDGSVWLWGAPGMNESRPDDRNLLPRPGDPAWLRPLQLLLGVMALAMLAATAIWRPARPSDTYAPRPEAA